MKLMLAFWLALFVLTGSACSAGNAVVTEAPPAETSQSSALPETPMIPSETTTALAETTTALAETTTDIPEATTLPESTTVPPETTTTPPETTTVAPTTTAGPIPPEILLLGDLEINLEDEETFQEPGYAAWDAKGKSLTKKVELEIAALPGADHSYQYRYSVTDRTGLEASAARIVHWKDTRPPELTLRGEASLSLDYGQAFQDPGAVAHDYFDGDLSEQIQVSGAVNSQQAGTYTITYSVKDTQGNTASINRTVEVKEAPPPTTAPPATQPAPSGTRTVYLTFDDGPFIYTERLLNILAKYNVKVTFFITAFSPEHAYLISRAVAEGHTVGLHTASHRYNEIYQSEEAYFQDLAIIADLYRRQTGMEPWLIRFPGGSSNTVSRQYNTGIMTRLARAVQERGYRYIDWNVSSADAADTWMSPETVYRNVIQGISGRDMSVVLMHDIKEHTVNAIESIIQWCQANGYTLLPINWATPEVHHNIQN